MACLGARKGRRDPQDNLSNTKENTVLAIEKTNDKPGAWLKVKVLGDDGKERNPMLTEPAVIEIVNKAGVGIYEFVSEKDGKYWKVTSAKFLRPLNGSAAPASQTPGNPGQSYTPRNPGQIDANTLLQNKAITSQVAMKVAGEVMGHALAGGAFKSTKDGIDVGGLSEAVNVLAGMLIQTAGTFIIPLQPEVKKDGSYVDDSGRKHEPVAE